MPQIEFPTKNVKYFTVNDVYIKADNASVNQYCTENGYTLVSYDAEDKRFSNDGGLAYQIYDGSEWRTEFGYDRVVARLIYS
jgi:hypothetical protein